MVNMMRLSKPHRRGIAAYLLCLLLLCNGVLHLCFHEHADAGADARVNLVTPELFAKYPDVSAFAKADVEDVEKIVRPCGFYRMKAADIIGMSRQIIERFDGRVPSTIEELTTLPGVGRKTANLIVGDIYGKPAVVTDTHVIRITNLLGLVATKNPEKVETELRKLLDPAESSDFCHRCVLHGRAVCIARRPQCALCCMSDFCKSAEKQK